MEEERDDFTELALTFALGLGGIRRDEYEKNLAAALERERRESVPRSDVERILRRQMPVEPEADRSGAPTDG